MKYFLQLVAESLIGRVGTDLSRTVVIFPNRRASLFLNDYLMDCAPGASLWMPRYMTISEFFGSLTKTQTADPIDTVCRMYRHYVRLTREADPRNGWHPTLDFFYGWGERLLADFDDVDKHLGNAEEIFRDLKDYKEIASSDFLTEEQKEQLRRFLGDFAIDDPSVVRERFLRLWRVLLPLYHSLRSELEAEGLAYEGQLYRQVVEAMQRGEAALPADVEQVAFVGFNVLDKAEQTLFALLQEQGKALFYWDYDDYYVNDPESARHEAGVFLRDNLRRFPNALEDAADFRNFLTARGEGGGRSITFAEADSEAIQAQHVTRWLSDPRNFDPKQARRTAVVLCNETLLQPVLHALPKGTEVNVTNGFPMGHTPVYALLVRRMDDILEARHESSAKNGEEQADLCETLRELQELVRQEAAAVGGANEQWLRELYAEASFTAYTTLSRFARLAETGKLQVSHTTLFRLLRQVLHSLAVPFHGEPAVGLQVMGVLETRCLDFDHVLMLSVNEGNVPQRATDASFIPFLIRQHYGLTTYIHKTSVFAYYFYRLLQRAERAELSYNVSTHGSSKGEMSRFMRSMLIDPRLESSIRRCRLVSTPRPVPFRPDEDVRPELCSKLLTRTFSPSSLTTYIDCPRNFYYKYVLGLKTPEPPDPLIANNDFGTLFHRAAELFYTEEAGKDGSPVTPEALRGFLQGEADATIRKVVLQAFEAEGIERKAIVEMAQQKYLRRLIEYEAAPPAGSGLQPVSFMVKGTEEKARMELDVPYGERGGTVRMAVGGTIDRLDRMLCGDGVSRWRIVDYKTGGAPHTASRLEDLFSGETKDSLRYTFQTFTYCLMVHERQQADGEDLPIVPALYFVAKMGRPDFTPLLKVDKKYVEDFREYADAFKKGLVGLLQDIVDPSNKFGRTAYEEHCKYCNYKTLCGVKEKEY